MHCILYKSLSELNKRPVGQGEEWNGEEEVSD